MKKADSNKERAEQMSRVLDHEHYYESSDMAQNKFNEMRTKRIKRICGDMRGKRVLDIGIGEGYMMREMEFDNDKFWGIDISSERCRKARKLLPGARIFVRDGKKTGFNDGFFDVTICADVLEHVDRPERVIEEMMRVTRKGGSIVVSVPSENMLILARIASFQFPIRNPDHIHKISFNWLARQFKRKPVEAFNLPNFRYPFCIWQCYRYEV